ncbi:MAG: hypothetical protein ACRDP8_22495 [Actinopolymorphaceae bacterium]
MKITVLLGCSARPPTGQARSGHHLNVRTSLTRLGQDLRDTPYVDTI